MSRRSSDFEGMIESRCSFKESEFDLKDTIT